MSAMRSHSFIIRGRALSCGFSYGWNLKYVMSPSTMTYSRGGCLEVTYQTAVVDSGPRIPRPVAVVNVLATLRGASDPERTLLMSGHYDSRASDPMDAESDAPSANDGASGTAAVLEAARVIAASGLRFPVTIVFTALAGEEQGLYGGRQLAEHARDEIWRIEGVLNSDIVGNVQGQDGIVDATTVPVFSESPAITTTIEDLRRMRSSDGEADGPPRQLARYVDRIAETYLPGFDVRSVRFTVDMRAGSWK